MNIFLWRRVRLALFWIIPILLFNWIDVRFTLNPMPVTVEAQAGQEIIVVLDITGITEQGCDDNIGGEEFRFRITINNLEAHRGGRPSSPIRENVVTPDGLVPFVIEVFEYDTFINWGDDGCDISEFDSDNDLNFVLDTSVCQITGDVTGLCRESIPSRGSSDESAEITFTVEWYYPPNVPGLLVRCTHTPIWPQPTDNQVSITVESLDGSENNPLRVSADTIAVTFNGDRTTGTVREQALGRFTQTYSLPAGSRSFSYQCDATRSSLQASSGQTRIVPVGVPNTQNGTPTRVVPVYSSVPSNEAIDILFVAEQDTYANGGPQDPAFLMDVERYIRDAYFDTAVYLRNQDILNLWIALDTRDVVTVVPPNPLMPTKCQLDETRSQISGWVSSHPFAETTAIIHSEGCAIDRAQRWGSARNLTASSVNVLAHETGHSPFGLADEYFVANYEAYFRTDPYPNIYWRETGESSCAEDAPDLGRSAEDCHIIDGASADDAWYGGAVWYTSEPLSNDLMLDNLDVQAADLRRMNWLFTIIRDN